MLALCLLLGPICLARHRHARKQLREAHQGRLRYNDGRFAQATPLSPGDEYHIFISYTWTTGADRTRIIKDRCVRARPPTV